MRLGLDIAPPTVELVTAVTGAPSIVGMKDSRGFAEFVDFAARQFNDGLICPGLRSRPFSSSVSAAPKIHQSSKQDDRNHEKP